MTCRASCRPKPNGWKLTHATTNHPTSQARHHGIQIEWRTLGWRSGANVALRFPIRVAICTLRQPRFSCSTRPHSAGFHAPRTIHRATIHVPNPRPPLQVSSQAASSFYKRPSSLAGRKLDAAPVALATVNFDSRASGLGIAHRVAHRIAMANSCLVMGFTYPNAVSHIATPVWVRPLTSPAITHAAETTLMLSLVIRIA